MTQFIGLRLNHGIFWRGSVPLALMLSADPLPQSFHRARTGAGGFTGFRINPLSCASPLGHPRLLRLLVSREPYRRPLRRDFPIGRLAAQDREGDARHLVGKRYGDKLEGLLLDQLLHPHPQRVGVGLTVKQHGVRAHDE